MTTSEILAVCAISLLAISALMAFGSFFNVNVFSSAPDWAYRAGLASSALSKKDQKIYWISISIMIFIAIVLLAVSQLLAPENYRAARGLGEAGGRRVFIFYFMGPAAEHRWSRAITSSELCGCTAALQPGAGLVGARAAAGSGQL